MNGDFADGTYHVLQLALGQNLHAIMDAGADWNAVWDYDARDTCERICQIVTALAALHQCKLSGSELAQVIVDESNAVGGLPIRIRAAT